MSMKKLEQKWNELDLATKLCVWCIVTYALLYVVLDILEELLGVAF